TYAARLKNMHNAHRVDSAIEKPLTSDEAKPQARVNTEGQLPSSNRGMKSRPREVKLFSQRLSSSGLYSALADAKESTIVPISSVVHDLVTSSLGSSPRDTLRHSESRTLRLRLAKCIRNVAAVSTLPYPSGSSTVEIPQFLKVCDGFDITIVE
ncbi:hypothetical protein E4U09_005486, partial [Claviceps aff. purpurea]